MKKIFHIILIAILLLACVDENGFYSNSENHIISLLCDITWASKITTYEDGNTWQGLYKFYRNGTYKRTLINTDPNGNKKTSTIEGQWSFSDPSYSSIYFGRENYWDIDEITQNKFTFYNRFGELGSSTTTREYTIFTPYKDV